MSSTPTTFDRELNIPLQPTPGLDELRSRFPWWFCWKFQNQPVYAIPEKVLAGTSLGRFQTVYSPEDEHAFTEVCRRNTAVGM